MASGAPLCDSTGKTCHHKVWITVTSSKIIYHSSRKKDELVQFSLFWTCVADAGICEGFVQSIIRITEKQHQALDRPESAIAVSVLFRRALTRVFQINFHDCDKQTKSDSRGRKQNKKKRTRTSKMKRGWDRNKRDALTVSIFPDTLLHAGQSCGNTTEKLLQ